MKKLIIIICIVYIFLFICGSVYAVGEKAILLGADATWKTAENRTGITESGMIRPFPVLLLSSNTVTSVDGYRAADGILGNFSNLTEQAIDMAVSFDETIPALFKDSVGKYRLFVPPDIESVDRVHARAGSGAALFGRTGMNAASGPIVIQPQSANALFAPGSRIKDFSIEFWLYPMSMENGGQILSWVSEMADNTGREQRINCSVSRNRLSWSFVNFFTSVNGFRQTNIDFTCLTPVIPKTWSHHLVRFDSVTGMLEYIVDGRSESIAYATSSGRENAEVHTPVIGNNGRFSLGGNFSGLMDEFKIHGVCIGRSSIQKYVSGGGRIETAALDLGLRSSGVVRIDASGGRTSIRGAAVQNEFRENGRFRFSDDSEMNFFIRAAENPYLLKDSPWINFTPGTDITGIKGRYVQIAADFYPSADGEGSPYLERISVVFIPGEPPLPARNLTASAKDGGVQLNWKRSPSANTAGYLVYYSAVRGELFGNDAVLGQSPIDAGNTENIYIDGLKNGTLYYFRVASYELTEGESRNVGEFSAETSARPLLGLIQ
jgi:hypothetical protein